MANNVIIGGLRRAVLNSGIAAIATTELSSDVHAFVVSGGAPSGSTIGQATLVAGAFQTTPTVVTNGQTANIQVDSSGNLRTTLVTGAGSTGADGVANTALFQTNSNTSQTAALRPLAEALFAYNGTTWDRVRNGGVAASGLLVQEGPFTIGRVVADGQIKGSAGFVHTVTIAPNAATPVAGVLTIYDSLTETGTVLLNVALPASVFAPFTVTLDASFATGLFIGFDATLTNTNVAVSFR